MRRVNAIPIESAYGNIPGFAYFDISVDEPAMNKAAESPVIRCLYLATMTNMIAPRGPSASNNGIDLFALRDALPSLRCVHTHIRMRGCVYTCRLCTCIHMYTHIYIYIYIFLFRRSKREGRYDDA